MDKLSKNFVEFKSALTRIIGRLLDNPVDVEDIVHEAYLRSLEASRLKSIDSPKAFIARTARNLALNHLTSAAVRLNEPIGAEDLIPSGRNDETVEDQVETARQFRKYCSAVEALPTQCRKVFTLKQVYGLSQKEIAGRLDITEKTVEYHVSKGLLHCRRHMQRAQANGSESGLTDSNPSVAGGQGNE